MTRYALIGWTCSIIPTIGWAIQYYGDESENCLRKESTATFLTLLWVELPIYVIAATNFVLLVRQRSFHRTYSFRCIFCT